jgi:hypothetical protein
MRVPIYFVLATILALTFARSDRLPHLDANGSWHVGQHR